MRARFFIQFVFPVSALITFSGASFSSNLPAPLDIKSAIEIAEKNVHPELALQQAYVEDAKADIEAAEAETGFEASLNLRARGIEPADTAINTQRDDHLASIEVRKPLYDFGASDDNIQSREISYTASQLEVSYALYKQQINVTRHFFDVVLSDLEFVWLNEAIAIAYIRFDKLRDRFKLKQVSDIDVLEAEAELQKVFTERSSAELAQASTRSLLAEAMNSKERPFDLVRPDLKIPESKLDDPEKLIEQAMANNISLEVQKLKVDAGQMRLNAESKKSWPQLDAEFNAYEYSRELPNRDVWNASLNLKIPLYETEAVSSSVAKARAKLKQERVKLLLLESRLRKDIYNLWHKINKLTVKHREMKAQAEYAARKLDKARGEYELELKTDFGVSQVDTSKAQYDLARNEFDLVLAQMKLALLLGQEPANVLRPAGEK